MSTSHFLKMGLLVSQEARHWADTEKSGFRMLMMQGVKANKRGLVLVFCPAAHSPLMSSCLQNSDHQQTVTIRAGDNQDTPEAWRQDFSSVTVFTCILPLFMTDFCRLIHTKISEDLACIFPNVYRETWKVKFLLSDSYSKASVSHNPPFRPAMGWRVELRWGCWCPGLRWMLPSQALTSPTSIPFGMTWIQQHWSTAFFSTAFY